MDIRYKNLIGNTTVFAVGNIIAKLSQYLIIALCTYKLSKAEFGISDTIIQTCTMLVPVFSGDIAEGLFRYSMDKNYSKKQIFSSSVVINLIGIVIALIAIPIEYLFTHSIQMSLFISILTALEMSQVSIKEFIRGIGLTKTYMWSGFVNALVQVVSCVLYIYVLNLGITGYMLTFTTALVVEIIFCFCKVNIYKYINRSSVSISVIKDLLKYSLPLAPNKIMWWIISSSDRYFVLWFISASATGLYSVAAKFPAVITIVVSVFFQAWQISAIENYNSDEKDAFFSKIFNLLWSVIGILTAIVVLLIRYVVKVLVAEEFFSAWEYAPFLLVAAAFGAIQSFLGVNYTISKDSTGALKSTSVAAISNLVLNWILINYIGIQGATIATLASYIIVTVYRFFDTKKYVHISINNKLGFFLTYLVLISECIIIAIKPDYYMIALPAFLIILFANINTIKNSFIFVVNLINRRRR